MEKHSRNTLIIIIIIIIIIMWSFSPSAASLCRALSAAELLLAMSSDAPLAEGYICVECGLLSGLLGPG